MALDKDATHGSRARLLAAGKTLFSQLGYEHTSTSAISREAGTSESQLARYFGGKSGLLETIFDEAWKPLNRMVLSKVASATNAHEAMLEVISTIVGALSADEELAFLFVFEGRRVRGSEGVLLSKGFIEFLELFRHIIERGQKDGSISAEFNAAAVASAMLGAGESMIRDRLLARRVGKPNPYSEREIRRVLVLLLDGLAVTDDSSPSGSSPSR